jgi:hypothetical protein
MSEKQPSKLLPFLFENVEEDRRLTVLNIGPALPETVTFFSRYRCRLHFADLFAELPIDPDDDPDTPLAQQFARMLAIPEGTLFDICLFWDLFNFLDAEAIRALMTALAPHLYKGTRAHGFALHNVRTPQSKQLFAISGDSELAVRARPTNLPGYAPHPQNRLKELLDGFNIVRSVLLADSRLEMALSAKA